MRDKRGPPVASSIAAPADSDESPKNSKRDGKPATERHTMPDQEVSLNRPHHDKGRRRRLQDPLPLEEASNAAHVAAAKDAVNDTATATVVPVNPTHVPRSGYYFQHDDRTAPMAGRNKRRTFDRSGWSEPRAKARYNERARDRSPDQQTHRRDDRRHAPSQVGTQSKSNDAWTHDKYLEAQAEELQSRKQRVVEENGFPVEGKHAGVHEAKDKLQSGAGRLEDGGDRKAEKRYPDMNLARAERERYRDRGEEVERGRWMDADQRSGHHQARGGGYGRFAGGRDRLGGGRSELIRRNSARSFEPIEKWTHDRYEEINRSPTPKQEDQISQIEALLAA